MNRAQRQIKQDALNEKIDDAELGFTVEMTPDEADCLGAFKEQALSEQEALDSIVDTPDDAELPHRITIKDREHHVIERDIP